MARPFPAPSMDHGSHDETADGRDDATLVAAAGAGDRQAFQTLYRKHMRAVYARLTRMLGPVPEREDLTQQVFLDLHRALPRFQGAARFSTFLHRIVVNVACETLARLYRDRARTAPLDARALEAAEAPDASPEVRARSRQELAQALAHLAALRPKKRAAFVLVAIEGLSLEEAAAIVDASPDTVKQRVLAARREIAARISRIARREGTP